MDSSVEGFGGEAGVLPLHIAGSGPEVGIRAGREGEVSDVDADAGEFHGLPGGGVLFDEQTKYCVPIMEMPLLGMSEHAPQEKPVGPWKKARISTPEVGREALGLAPMGERTQRKAISYLRFSNVKQADGGSEARQVDLTDEYCEREGLELVERYHDLGKSAHHGKHRTKGRFGDLMKAVESGQIPAHTVLIVESFDRLSREEVITALERFLSLINTYLLEIHVLENGQSPSIFKKGAVNDHRLMMAIMEMSRAYGESARKGVLISAAWQAQRERGVPVGKKGGKPMGLHPSWLVWEEPGKWREIPERVEVIKRIFQLSMEGRLGRCEVAVRLCQDKALYWGRRNGWTASNVQQLLANPAVTGRLDPQKSNHPGAEAVEDYYPRIISDETYLEAQRVSSARRLGGGRPKTIHPEALLTGITWAKGCRVHRGNSHQKTGNHLTYCFMKANKNVYLAMGKGLEELVLNALGKMTNSDLIATDADAKRQQIDAGIAEMRRLRQESEERVNNLVTALSTGRKGEDYDIPELRTALMAARMDRDDCMKRILALESERDLLPMDGIDVRERLLALVKRADSNESVARTEVRSLLSRLISRIDAVRTTWPEWENRKNGALAGMLPDWALEILDKGFTMFSEAGPLDPLMVAIQMRNGRQIAIMQDEHTVLLLRPAAT